MVTVHKYRTKMIVYNKLLSILSLLLCGLFLIAACENAEENKARHLQQGKKYFGEENYDKARVELKNVLQVDPKSAEAYNLLGQIEEYNKNWRKAIAHYYQAIELAPDLLGPKIRLGRFYIQQASIAKKLNNTDTEDKYIKYAKKKVDAAIQIDPLHTDTLVLKASLLAYQGSDDEAIRILQKVLEINPKSIDSVLLLSRIYVHKNLNKEAEKLLKKGIIASPEKVDTYVELAKFYINLKQFDNTTKVIQKIILLEPESFDHRLSLASYYLLQHRPEKAEEVYQEAIKAAPGDSIRYLTYADFISKQKNTSAAINYLKNIDNTSFTDKEISFKLVSVYQEAGETDQAIALLDNIIKSSKLSLTGIRARKKLLTIHLSKNDITSARPLIEEILAENPKDHGTLLIKGKIAIQEKDYDLAITLFRTALKHQIDSIEILHLLAEAHVLNREMHLAEDLLKRAIKTNPDNLASHLTLANFMLASNKDDLALEQINLALQIEPEHINAIILKSDILMKRKKIQEVISLLYILKKLAPDNAEGWFRMGRIYKLINKKNHARQEFISAFNKAPDSIDLLAELTDIEIELGDINSTKQRLQDILKEQPEHRTAHMFLGMAYLAENKPDSAEKEFILHLQQSPDDVTAYIQLGNIEYNRKNINRAAQYYLKGKKVAPENIDILLGIAHIRTIQKKYDNAISLYEKISGIQPDNAVAINNLAMILANKKSDPDSLVRAKKLIQNSSSKNHPALLDSLGWIYYLLEDYDNAHSSLGKAIASAPDIPTFHYHIAMVYLKKADNDLARKHLQIALKLDNFPERIDAARALEQLQSPASEK